MQEYNSILLHIFKTMYIKYVGTYVYVFTLETTFWQLA